MGDTQPKLTLRELAREYAGGRIDRETFRSRRAKLLDELSATEVTTKSIEAEPVADKPASPIQPVSQKKSHIPLIAGVAIGSVLLLIGVLLILLPDKSLPELEVVAEPPNLQAAKPAEYHEIKQIDEAAAKDVLMTFIKEGDWSRQKRGELLTWWSGLDTNQREHVRSSSWFLMLGSELKTLVEEERGLAGESGSPTITSLVDFGSAFGFDLSTPDAVRLPILGKDIEIPTKAQKSGTKEDRHTDSVETTPPPELKTVPHESGKTAPKAPEAKPDLTTHLPEDANQTAILKPVQQKAVNNPSKPSTASEKAVIEPVGERRPDRQEAKAVKDQTSAPPSVDTHEQPPVFKSVAQTRDPDTEAAKPASESCRPLAFSRKIPKCRDQLDDGGKGPWLRLLPGGLFTMGNDDFINESPSHKVRIDYPFAISSYEITQGEYDLFCKETHRTCPKQPWTNADLPVVNVSQDDAKDYAKWLSAKSGLGYRLPTEAEWEYAARAGSSGPFPLPENDLGTYAHYSRHGDETQPLPRRPQRTNPNKFGLFHMAGNVREWVLDDWSESYLNAPDNGAPVKLPGSSLGVVRGGSFGDSAEALRSAARISMDKSLRDTKTGFRLVRDIYMNGDRDSLPLWGGWWLLNQNKRYFTIMLSSSKSLKEIASQSKNDSTINTYVIQSRNSGYSLCYGIFSNESQASAGYKALPKALRETFRDYKVLSIGTLQQAYQ